MNIREIICAGEMSEEEARYFKEEVIRRLDLLKLAWKIYYNTPNLERETLDEDYYSLDEVKQIGLGEDEVQVIGVRYREVSRTKLEESKIGEYADIVEYNVEPHRISIKNFLFEEMNDGLFIQAFLTFLYAMDMDSEYCI